MRCLLWCSLKFLIVLVTPQKISLKIRPLKQSVAEILVKVALQISDLNHLTLLLHQLSPDLAIVIERMNRFMEEA
jgi:hypothetical protein